MMSIAHLRNCLLLSVLYLNHADCPNLNPNVIFPTSCHIAVLAIVLNLYLLTIICLKPTLCLIFLYLNPDDCFLFLG